MVSVASFSMVPYSLTYYCLGAYLLVSASAFVLVAIPMAYLDGFRQLAIVVRSAI